MPDDLLYTLDQLAATLLDEIEAARNLQGVLDDPPGDCYRAWQTAAITGQQITSRMIELSGLAAQRCTQAAWDSGQRCCATCRKWYPQEQMKHNELPASKKGESRGIWWRCHECPPDFDCDP